MRLFLGLVILFTTTVAFGFGGGSVKNKDSGSGATSVAPVSEENVRILAGRGNKPVSKKPIKISPVEPVEKSPVLGGPPVRGPLFVDPGPVAKAPVTLPKEPVRPIVVDPVATDPRGSRNAQNTQDPVSREKASGGGDDSAKPDYVKCRNDLAAKYDAKGREKGLTGQLEDRSGQVPQNYAPGGAVHLPLPPTNGTQDASIDPQFPQEIFVEPGKIKYATFEISVAQACESMYQFGGAATQQLWNASVHVSNRRELKIDQGISQNQYGQWEKTVTSSDFYFDYACYRVDEKTGAGVYIGGASSTAYGRRPAAVCDKMSFNEQRQFDWTAEQKACGCDRLGESFGQVNRNTSDPYYNPEVPSLAQIIDYSPKAQMDKTTSGGQKFCCYIPDYVKK